MGSSSIYGDFMKKFNLHKLTHWALIAAPILIALFYAIIAPYMSDDWAWATSTGEHRFHTFFENYNGRYLGNLYILALSRCEPLWILSLPVAIFLILFFIKKFIQSDNILYYFIPAAALGIMSREMFRQIIMWRSGFSNYVPPALAILFYMVIIRNIFDDNVPEYKKGASFITYIISVVGALFMENLTLYCIALDVSVLIYTKIKFKKVFFPHIMHLAGSITGGVIMFSNSAYINILKGNDASSYRTFGGTSILDTIINNSAELCEWLFENSARLFLIVSLVLLVLIVSAAKKSRLSKRNTVICLSCLAITFAYEITMLIYPASWAENLYLRIISALVFYLCLIAVTVLLPLQNKADKTKALFSLVSAVVMAMPMLLISPISPRCFFASFMMETVALCIFVKNLVMQSNKKTYFAVLTIVAAVFIASHAFYATKFYTVHQYHQAREDYIQTQIENNSDTIKIPLLPESLHPFSRSSDYKDGTVWKKRFCEFYKIDYENKNVIQCPWDEANIKP